jgi:hypothetical protein
VRHVNHVTSKQIVAKTLRSRVRAVAIEGLTHNRTKAGLRTEPEERSSHDFSS